MYHELITLKLGNEAECNVWVECTPGLPQAELEELARVRLLALLGKHVEVVR